MEIYFWVIGEDRWLESASQHNEQAAVWSIMGYMFFMLLLLLWVGEN